MESKPAVFAMRAISTERTRRTVIEATTSSRASFSFTLLRTISLGRSDMAFLPGNCSLLYAGADREIRARSDRKCGDLRRGTRARCRGRCCAGRPVEQRADSFARYTAAKPPALVYVCHSPLKHQGVHR